MFSNLGLFSQVPCPDKTCKRQPCFFSHDPALKREIFEGEPEAREVKRAKTSQPNVTASGHSVAIPVPRSYGSSSSNQDRKAPILRVESRLSRQPILDRRKGLEKIHNEYCLLYQKILSSDPELAANHALAEEQSISLGTTKASYGPAIHSASVAIRQRPIPKTLSSRHVGTNAEVKAKIKKWEKEQSSKLGKGNVERYCIDPNQLQECGFMVHVPKQEGNTHTTSIGENKICDRCGVEFNVQPLPPPNSHMPQQEESDETEQHHQSDRACVYHWGKATMDKVDGRRMARWSCCGADRTLNEPGCAFAESHVFKDGRSWRFSARPSVTETEERIKEEKQEIDLLHSRQAFKTVSQVRQSLHKRDTAQDKVHDVLALDCEMIYTPAGMSLARVSVLDSDGLVVLDDMVKQASSILDVNAKFSGLSLKDMQKASKPFDQVRQDVCRLLHENTVLIGHGLENDLKALRLVHLKIIDTAVLFPHPRGPPFKRALKDLTSEKLGVFIQNNILEEGHDSGADARAALDLVKWQVRKDKAAPGDFSYV